MATFTKQLLSESTNGKSIDVTADAHGSAVTIHQAVSGTSSLDEVWLYCLNVQTGDILLTLTWGDNTDEEDGYIQVTIPGQSGLIQVVPGLLLQNSLYIKAYASVANKLMIHGFVNRIS